MKKYVANKVIEGRVWVIRDEMSSPIDDIDTDMIYHNKHLAITDINEMGDYAFGNLNDWKDFPMKVNPGDILVVGENFGAGSSRQHAVDCFIALGIVAIVGESFGAIYYRNAVNAALPIFVVKGIMNSKIASGNIIQINIISGKLYDKTGNFELPSAIPLSDVQLQIIECGGILQLATKIK